MTLADQLKSCDLTRSVVLTPAVRDAAVMWDRLCLTSAYPERRIGVSKSNNIQTAAIAEVTEDSGLLIHLLGFPGTYHSGKCRQVK